MGTGTITSPSWPSLPAENLVPLGEDGAQVGGLCAVITDHPLHDAQTGQTYQPGVTICDSHGSQGRLHPLHPERAVELLMRLQSVSPMLYQQARSLPLTSGSLVVIHIHDHDAKERLAEAARGLRTLFVDLRPRAPKRGPWSRHELSVRFPIRYHRRLRRGMQRYDERERREQERSQIRTWLEHGLSIALLCSCCSCPTDQPCLGWRLIEEVGQLTTDGWRASPRKKEGSV